MDEREQAYLTATAPEELARLTHGMVDQQRFRFLAAERLRRILPSVGEYDRVRFEGYRAWIEDAGPPFASLNLQDEFDVSCVPDSSGMFIDLCWSCIRSDRPMFIAVDAAEAEARDFPRFEEPPLGTGKHSRTREKRAARKAVIEQLRQDWKTEFENHRRPYDSEFGEQFRCVAGNPFRPVVVHPDWLTPTVVGIAAAIDVTLAIDRLPILADALQDAGCTQIALLDHVRGPNVHVRGCWVIDLLLGRLMNLSTVG